MTTEEYAQYCIDKRGYLVVGTGAPRDIGQITVIDDQPGTETDAKGVIVAETNREDMAEQLRSSGLADMVPEINALYFYRVMAE